MGVNTQISRQPNDWMGWAAGGGVEMMLGSPNWIGRIEYLHYDFGTVRQADVIVATTPNTSLVNRAGRQTMNTGRVALSYKFGDVVAATRTDRATDKTPLATRPGMEGFYVGVHGGAGRQHNDFSDAFNNVPRVSFDGITSNVEFFGGQFGRNWQYGEIVTGLELDFSAARGSGSSSAQFTSRSGKLADDIKSLGTARARLGFQPTTNSLFYATAGLAWERLEQTTQTVQAVPASSRTITRPKDWFGWVAGLGAETTLGSPNWIARAEYLHYDFGTVQPSLHLFDGWGTLSVDTAGRLTVNVARVGLSYRLSP